MLIPAIDILNGQVVRLSKGSFSEVTDYDLDPVTHLRYLRDNGAQFVHLVDLDGAKNPANRQLALIEKLLQVEGVQIQIGGGVRSEADISALVEAGVNRVVVGTAAVSNYESFATWVNMFGSEKLCVALDVATSDDGKREVAVNGWQESSGVELQEAIEVLVEVGMTNALCTDISRDGMMVGPNAALYKDLATNYPNIRWQASGGVSCLEDLTAFRSLDLEGVIVGKAILSGAIDLKEGLRCLQSE